MPSRFATTLLLCLQFTALAVGTLPEREACCCVARGKPCKCKSHGGAKHSADDERPCFSAGCSSPDAVAFPVVVWVSLPEFVGTPVRTPTATLTWPLPAEGPERGRRPEAPPPRVG